MGKNTRPHEKGLLQEKKNLQNLLVVGLEPCVSLTESVLRNDEGHCVPYYGGSKEETQAANMVNRERLLKEGVVSQADYDKAVALMEKKRKK